MVGTFSINIQDRSLQCLRVVHNLLSSSVLKVDKYLLYLNELK